MTKRNGYVDRHYKNKFKLKFKFYKETFYDTIFFAKTIFDEKNKEIALLWVILFGTVNITILPVLFVVGLLMAITVTVE